MKTSTKYIIAGGIGIVSITAMLAWLQYRKLMNYCIGLKSINVKKLNENIADIDLFLNFKNNSNIKIEIERQEYNVYVNDKFLTKASNAIPQIINPDSTSVIGVNVKFNPSKAGQNILDVILSPNKLVFKIEVKLKVKLWGFTVNIPYTYNTTVKELLAPSKEPKTQTKC